MQKDEDLEKKLRDNHAAWTEDNLWAACAAADPGKVKGRLAEVERRLSVVEELGAVVSVNLQLATRLRQSILQKAFTGGIV